MKNVSVGESAKVTEVIVADKNPLYLVENKEGKSKAIHGSYLDECGVAWG